MPRGLNIYDDANLQRRLWTPVNILPKILAWHDASDLSTISVATGVSNWMDKSGRGNHAVQATSGSQPTLILGEIKGIDGINSSRHLYYSSAIFSNESSGSVIFSGTASGAGGGWGRMSSFTTLDNHTPYDGDKKIYESFLINSRQILATLDATYYNVRVIVCFNNTGSKLNVIFNGTEYSPVNVVLSLPTGSASNQRLLGLYSGYKLHELILTNQSLTTSERKLLEGYLANKWKTNSSLPANHVYRNRPPMIGN